jgi:hypothetical protein
LRDAGKGARILCAIRPDRGSPGHAASLARINEFIAKSKP